MSAKIPDGLSFEQAAPMTCAGATIYNGLKACELKKGQSVGIIGLGALGRHSIFDTLACCSMIIHIGHIGVQLAKVMVSHLSLDFAMF